MKKKWKGYFPHGEMYVKIFRMMKLCTCLLLCSVMSISANVRAQYAKMSLDLKGVTLEEVIWALEKKSDITFFYNVTDVERINKMNAVFKDAPLENILNEVLKNTGLYYEIQGRVVVIKRNLSSFVADSLKSVTIKGIVTDNRGEILPGVSVILKGMQTGVATGIKGDFSLNISKRDSVVLVFSFVGMRTKEVKWTGEALLKVTLEEDINEIGEIVITGYQQLDRRKSTSATNSFGIEEIKIPGVTNLTQMLEGKIPDMVVLSNSGEINATPRLRIRGTSTIIGNREPLWVVDGIIVSDPVNLSPDVLNDPDYVNRIGNAISGVNPQDIERLDVLKDAAATALYGTRAANGVIVITTKKGRTGKPIVSYSATATLRQRPRYTDRKINLMNSKERIQFSRDLVANHYVYQQNMPLVGYENALSKYYDGTYTEEQFQAEVARLQTVNTDWFDLLTHDSFSHDHSINVSGGSEAVRYYASLGYTNEDDVIQSTTNHRYTATAKLDMTLSPKIQLSFNLNGYLNDREYNQSEVNPIDYAYHTSRSIPAFNEDGTYAYYQKYVSFVGFLNYNILNELENSFQEQSVSGFTATANLRYNITDWLNVNAILSGTTSAAEIEGYWGEKTFHVADLRRSEYGEKAPENSMLPYGGELTTNTTKTKSYMARLQANLSKYLGKNQEHYLNVSIGAEVNATNYNAFSYTQRGYYADRGKSFVTDIDPGYYATYYASWVKSNVPVITDNRTNLLAVYGTVSYSYKDYFTLNANTRYDGSNKFGSRSNEKILPVWSVSGMVDLKAVTRIDAAWLDSFTMKASYGEQGNMLDGQTPVLVLKKGSYSDYYDKMISTVANGGFANPDLKWEKTHSSNFGLEALFFKSRLMVGVEYYYKKTTDAFMSKQISDINGFTSYTVNSGTVINKGYNLNLTTTPVKLKDFNWIFSGSLSKILNEMNTAPGQNTYELNDFLNGTAVVKGKAIGTFYSYKYVGLSPVDGGPLFDDWEDRRAELVGLDKYNTYTRVLKASGQRDPDVTGGISNTFTYKHWRLGVQMNYSLGAKTRLFRMMEDFVNGYSAESNVNRDLLKAWKKPGDELYTDVPAIMGRGSNGFGYYSYHWSAGTSADVVKIADNAWTMYDYSDLRVVSADYLKISSISLTYEFPKKILERWRLNRLALTLGATNLHTFCNSKLKGQTPTQGGFSEIQLSDTPTYTIGLNLQF